MIHHLLLLISENDPELRRATVLDGRLLNFLFSDNVTKAVRGKKLCARLSSFLTYSSNNHLAKRYLRCLHEEQQDLAVKFYHQVCRVTMEYHSSLRGYGLCSCCITSSAKEILDERLATIFQEFISELALHQNAGLIDDI